MTAAGESPPAGFGRMLRKEDQRFIRGLGTYVDDVQLPGTLHGACYAARTRTPASCPSTPSRPRRTPR